MRLSKYEQETIILYNEEEATASVYTHDPKLMEKLERLSMEYPDKIYTERKEHPGAVSYIVPKKCVMVHETFRDARKKAMSEKAKIAGRKPPVRTKKAN